MGKQYVNELNKAIYNSPVLARSEILSSRKETLFDTIEGCFVRAGLLDTLPAAVGGRLVHGRDPHDGTGYLRAAASRTMHRLRKEPAPTSAQGKKKDPLPVFFTRKDPAPSVAKMRVLKSA